VDAHLLPRAQAGGLAVRRNARLASLEAVRHGGEAVWRATDESGGVALFRCAALAVPAPQALQLGGDVACVLAAGGLTPLLGAVAFSTRLAVAIYFAPESAAFFEAALPWAGRFVDRAEPGGDKLRYLAFETRKRRYGGGAGGGIDCGGAVGAPIAFIAHTTIEYGAAHESTPDFQAALGPELVAAACAALARAAGVAGDGALPFAPVESRVHRWKYSQMTAGVPAGSFEAAAAAATAAGSGVEVRVEDCGAAVAVRGARCRNVSGGGDTIVPSPPLIISGDWMTSSNMAGCLRSAEAANALAVEALGRR
jgi:hypothetical protein